MCTNLDSIQPGHPPILNRVFPVLSVGNYMQTRQTDQTELMHRLTAIFSTLLILAVNTIEHGFTFQYLISVVLASTYFAFWVIFCRLILSKSAFSKNYFRKYHQSVKQFGSRSRQSMRLSILIWVQSACKGYQQTTKVTKCK